MWALSRGRRQPDEIVVVDQSDDERTRQLLDQPGARDVPFTYARQAPLGLGAAQNHGCALARGEILAVTDDDCIPDARWLECIGDVFGRSPGLAALSGRVLPLPPAGECVEPVASRTSPVARSFSGKDLPWRVGSGNNFAVKREWFARVGGCDERLGPGSPGRGAVDMDLFYRLLRAGGPILYEPACLVHHQRQTRDGRMQRRYPYGYGMGACLSQLLVEGDLYALRMLAAWLRLRGRALMGGLRRREATRVLEELRVISGTLVGLLHPLRRLASTAAVSPRMSHGGIDRRLRSSARRLPEGPRRRRRR